MTDKERILKIVEGLPETATSEDVIAALYFMDTVDRGLADAATGRVVSHEEAKRRLARSLKS